ncbi:MAG TPA: bifunctional methylenetetrahydrofolate dehydrogenase/methenyltetrahydrofolate cyclohydrolase FolD [Actinobacteria bacterium]|nr:bifunctional methylenetetrahydrofolate dehydrogenase/methenyltetrahydrofolate cyclohydrolase FolD [Actinomycetota bacterium]
MSARLLSGNVVAAAVRAEVAARVAALRARGITVGLATVLVGDDPASAIYVRNKRRAAEEAGMRSIDVRLPATATQAEVEATLERLNADPRVDGIILQLPLPEGLDGQAAVARIDPAKDADGLHPRNLGLLVLERPGPRPATPAGILRLLRYYEIPTAGRVAVVVGRSFLVGRPLALELGARGVDATVVQAHSKTPALPELCRRGDILVAAIGRPRMIDASYVKPGAVVIDVGINRVDEGLVGDVDAESVGEVAAAITPVPGGVGPMTIAALLENTVALAEGRADDDRENGATDG